MMSSNTYNKDGCSALHVCDPIHGQIIVDYPFSAIIKAKEMQRLKRITQTGFSFFDYPNLRYEDRLSHSIGAYYIMLRMLDKLSTLLSEKGIFISEDEKNIALSAMLLHDIGHGPFSHSFETISNYSHEKRTTDILLGDTEVNKILVSTFGKAKTLRIASFIAEIDESRKKEDDFEETNFTRLIKSLISHQIDADRLDYIVRDAYYSGINTSINIDKIIDSINIIMNVNGEYELIVDKKNLTLIETPLIERFQHYRDIYFTTSSIIGDRVFKSTLQVLRENDEKMIFYYLPDVFSKLVYDPQNLLLDDFLRITDNNVFKCLEVIRNSSKNALLRKLCAIESCIKGFIIFDDVFCKKLLMMQLSKMLGIDEDDMQSVHSIYEIYSKTKFYKKDEGFKIKSNRKVLDLTDVTNLVNARDYVEVKCSAFNPEIFFIENNLLGRCGITLDEFMKKIDILLNEFQLKDQEFELKYLLFDDIHQAKCIKNNLEENGFEVLYEKEFENVDDYFDTEDLELYKASSSLRIRKVGSNYKGTYKEPLDDGSIYTSRVEIEEILTCDDFDEFRGKLEKRGVKVDFERIIKEPCLKVVTFRKEYLLSKNGSRVCFSIDDVKYISVDKNKQTGKKKSCEIMIEIEAADDATDRYLLYEIHELVSSFAKKYDIDIKVINESKYKRGMSMLGDSLL